MLLSSVAEHVYWMARYVERAENTARIILVNNNLLLDMPRSIELGWEPLVAITGNADLFREHYDEASERNVIRFLVSDVRNSNCIINSLAQARENLRTTRAILPRAVWETLNDLHAYASDNKTSGTSRRGRYAFMRRIIDYSQLLAGKLSSTMSHDQTYDFLRMGRNMERADMTTRVIDVRGSNLLPSITEELRPFDDIQWKSVLDSLAAYQMYRRHVHVRVRGREVLRFLLQDTRFPRAVRYCLAEVESCLRSLDSSESPLRALGMAQRVLSRVGVDEIVGDGLTDFINEFQLVHSELNTQITASYFEVGEELAELQAASA
ncbi:MAG: alpha-E domain-containing protein [Thiogranum sp.]